MNRFVLRPGSEYAKEGKSLLVRQRITQRQDASCRAPPHTPAELQELHDLAAQWGKIIARRTGDDAIEFDLSAWRASPRPPPPGWSKAP